MANERFDGLFMSAVQQAQGIDNFFDSLFGFFGRKTDLYTKETDAMTMVNRHLTRHIGLFKEQVRAQEAIQKKKEEEKKKREAALAEAKEKAEAQVAEVTAEEAELIEKEEAEKKKNPAAATAAQEAAKEKNDEENKEEEDEKEKGMAPNAQNGGETDRYTWEQTLGDVTVNVKIPDGITSKQLEVKYTKTHFKVSIKGQEEPLVDGDLCKPIKVDDSLWCIETDNQGKRFLQVNFTKVDRQNWWDCVCQGDAKINTQKVEPENSKLSDLDGDTRSVVEKMMFDQQQKQKGLPTSEELEKKNKLQAFMDAHPEMDFSKAKFS